MAHRVFVALPVPLNLRERVAEWRHTHMHLPLRWVADHNLHVTIVPPWEEPSLATARKQLQSLAGRSKEIPLVFNTMSYGPSPRTPCLIWAAGAADSSVLELKALLEHALDKLPEQRPFLPHITIARFLTEDFTSLPPLADQIDWRGTFSQCMLMESLGNSDYRMLEQIALTT